jgi:hypothetical protein
MITKRAVLKQTKRMGRDAEFFPTLGTEKQEKKTNHEEHEGSGRREREIQTSRSSQVN